MKILQLRVMRGPNYWSNQRKQLIVIKLDLGQAKNMSTRMIEGFGERLEQLLPSLLGHECSVGRPGGFLERVHEGTWLGHVVEHVALELQSMAGMEVGYGRTLSAGEKGVYNVVFSYLLESAGLYAAKAAVKLVECLARDMEYDALEDDITELKRMYRRGRLGPSTQAIVDEALRRNIPVRRLDNNSRILLGQGCHQKLLCATITGDTAAMGADLAADKDLTKSLLEKHYVPVPEGRLVSHADELDSLVEAIGFPMVLKPVNGNHGRGISTNINSREELQDAFLEAQKISRYVVAERFICGNDYRFLVVNYKLVAVAKRVPARVTGDGSSTILQLVEETNRDPRRGEGHECPLTQITLDTCSMKILTEKGYTPDDILPIGEILYLKDTANLSTGGTSHEVTEHVHPHNVFLAERIARLMHLDICGIDIMARDVDVPITKDVGAVLEVNACPGLRMHSFPSKGLGINVAAPIVDMLYPVGAVSRIPIVAVTGTNGKTTTTRLIAHIAQKVGHHVGFITTDGIYINGHALCYGDCSGPGSAELILRDPIVDFAVFETARGGILRAGLGFDQCNISVITNITGDHLGLGGIHTLRELARVKEVVVQSTMPGGYAILNADDDLAYEMKKKLDCKVALFSLDENSPRIHAHCMAGGYAAIVENGHFVICNGKWKSRIARVSDVPLTLSGNAACMIQNILPSILAASLSGFSNELIIAGLMSFHPSPEMTPGRMNLFRFKNFRVMVDYAHNEGGFVELEKYMNSVRASMKIGIIAATGDRREDDIRAVGRYAARIFDEIIIRHDDDGRGRSNEELTQLLMEGIQAEKPTITVHVISNENESIQYAIDHAPPGALVLVCADHVQETLEMVKNAQENDLHAVSEEDQEQGMHSVSAAG